MSNEVGEKALVVVNEARELVIRDEADWKKADGMVAALYEYRKRIEDAYDDIIESARVAWKTALAKKATYYKPVDEEIKLLKSKMGIWKTQYEADRRVLEEKLYQQAVDAEIERRKMAAEVAPEIAEDIMAEPMTVAPVIIPNAIKSDAKFRTIWDVEVVDFDALIQAVVDKKISNIALLPNEKFLREQARSFKQHLQIPGVRSYSKVV